MGIFNDEWENEVYRLKARIKELEKENKNLRAQLTKQKIQAVKPSVVVFHGNEFQCGYVDEL